MEVLDVDIDLFARFDVGNFLREDVRPLLRHQRCDVTLAASGFVDLLSLFSFANHSADLAFADSHHEVIDGRVLRQRKHVDRFDFGVVWIVELLRDVDAGDVTLNVALNIGVL